MPTTQTPVENAATSPPPKPSTPKTAPRYKSTAAPPNIARHLSPARETIRPAQPQIPPLALAAHLPWLTSPIHSTCSSQYPFLACQCQVLFPIKQYHHDSPPTHPILRSSGLIPLPAPSFSAVPQGVGFTPGSSRLGLYRVTSLTARTPARETFLESPPRVDADSSRSVPELAQTPPYPETICAFSYLAPWSSHQLPS